MNSPVAFIYGHNYSKETFFDIMFNKITIIVNYTPISLNIGEYLSPIFTSCCISKPKNLISQYCWDRMLVRLNLGLGNEKYVNNLVGYNFVFNTDVLLANNFVISLLANRILQIVFLSIVVLLMRELSTILCNGYLDKLLTGFLNFVYKIEDDSIKNKQNFPTHNMFINYYNHIISLSHWVYKYVYNLSYAKLYYNILFTIYVNIKHLIPSFHINYALDLKRVVNYTFKMIFSLRSMVTFFYMNLNVIYACLTIVYVVLGWLLDYLSFTWLVLSKGTEFKYVTSLGFWIKRSFYATLYIIWLYAGVITTNGVYFTIMKKIDSSTSVDIIITVVGSIVSYLASNLWYFYGKAIVPESLNIKNTIIIPLLLNPMYRISTYAFYISVRNRLLHYIFMPVSFNYFSTLRRSFLEWISFLGMVFSTYSGWNLYTAYVFNHLSVVNNLLIWIGPSIIGGYAIIYLEETRPIFGHLFYGLIYLLLWHSICYFTNSVVVGYFSIINAVRGLYYFLPMNFFLAFIYSVPLYRNTVRLTVFNRLVHVFFLTLLISITLISAGLIWYLIGGT